MRNARGLYATAPLAILASVSVPIYDSAAPSPSIVQDARATWRSRSLLRVLVTRDLAVRYKRSVLGVWWTLLNPLLETAVLWMVFSHVFRFAVPGVPYAVFVLSGILVFNCFRQTILGAAGSMFLHADLLSKVRIAPAVFSLSTAGANTITFGFTLVPLAVVMALSGVAPNPALPLIVPVVMLLVLFAFGLGLALAPIVVRFPDTLDLLTICVTMVGYLAPVFYPPEIVPEEYRVVEHLNPIYHFVTLFRDLLYGHGAGSALSWLAIVLSAGTSVLLGHLVHNALRRGAFTVL
jgi:ABC-2 type transport system permease protein